MVTNVKLDSERSEYEENLVLYFSDSQQLQGLVEELTEQNLSLVQNSNKVNEIHEELRQTVCVKLKKMEVEEENLMLQAKDMRDRTNQERLRIVQLTKKVQLHDSLRTADQDIMLNALGVKVTEVHRCCVDSRPTSLSTLEKLSSIEYHMALLLQHIENIPEESLENLRQIKDSERRSRLREEKLRLEREKQEKRMEKCTQRSLSDAKKIRGRKLMPRCIPVEQKTEVYSTDDLPAEDEFQAHLFNPEDV
ncbi:cilia- and flagella-associated protein 100-like [Toxotes jaculatrix]|uniref:cilia- and flagella-associated protein 100-like n=1 Tax=Toxotes jaculatrix TaxID=941984 RepID=UPI001B3ACA26|nr:cilia- and flagella-associated protein 100-like [Toxotes jaculatrix]